MGVVVVQWDDQPADNNYPAARSYLSLVMPDEAADDAVTALADAGPAAFKAKDLMRASTLPLLPRHNRGVASILRKIRAGNALSPVLLVRGAGADPLLIADGYHRVCASYHTDANTVVPCRIVDTPT